MNLKKLNYKGISYIEVILVLTIMILMTGFASVTMAIVNRNNVTKGADRTESGFSHAKTLSLSKGMDKGAITFLSEGNKVYYYYGDNINDKYLVCNSPCYVTFYINDDDPTDTQNLNEYDIKGSTQVRYMINQSTGALYKAQVSLNGGGSFFDVVEDMDHFDSSKINKIVVDNPNRKAVTLNILVHVGKVNVSY